jgi:hypothetical protein
VRKEAANRATSNCWYQRQCGAFGVHLGSAVISARAELGSITTSALPAATLLTRQRECVCCWCAWDSGGGLRGDAPSLSVKRFAVPTPILGPSPICPRPGGPSCEYLAGPGLSDPGPVVSECNCGPKKGGGTRSTGRTPVECTTPFGRRGLRVAEQGYHCTSQ